MCDRELFKRICGVSCTPEELFDFTIHIDKQEFDTDNPFDKYYSLKTIISAAEKYRNGIIDEKFLTHWCTAYDWIINGGFKRTHSKDFILKDIVIWEISDWLDAFSFFESEQDCCKIENYLNALTGFDTILHEIDDCKGAYALLDFDDEESYYETGILIVNEKAKYYAEFYEDFDLDLIDLILDRVDNTQLKRQ